MSSAPKSNKRKNNSYIRLIPEEIQQDGETKQTEFQTTLGNFNNYIDNIQCSWVKLGPKLAQVSLNYGVNDFSGTLMEENISRSAGAEFGQYLSPLEIIDIIKAAGKRPAQRDTLYNILKYY